MPTGRITAVNDDDRRDHDLQDELLDCSGDDSDLIELLRLFEQEENDDYEV
jgi:hypothetical protein